MLVPWLPALYGVYKGYKTSEEAYSGKITREQAMVKMCDVKNKVAMSGYLSQLLAQMAPLLEKTCGDKIARCKKQCNDLIDGFKDDFKLCFSKVAFEGSNGSVNDIIDFAKKCEGIESISNSEISTLTDAKALSTHCAVQKDAGEDVTVTLFDSTEGVPDKVTSYVTKETIGYILLFAKAYTFSSAIKKKEESILSENSTELSENSNESEIVKCSYQPDRVVTKGKKPGAPVPPPMIDICQRAVDGIINDNPYPPPMPPVPPFLPSSDSQNSHTGTFTGGDLQQVSKGVFYRDPNEEYGVVPEPSGELPDLVNKPGLQKNLPGWAGSSPSSGSGPGASGGVGGGSPSGGSRSPSKGDFGFPYAGTGAKGDIAGAFSGSDHYPNVVGTSGTAPPYRRSAGDKSTGKKKNLKDRERNQKDKIDSNGSSIFQMASQRIQEFCSGYSCMK